MTDTATIPRGLQITAAWLDQIHAATGRQPDPATAARVQADCFRDRPCRDCATPIGQTHSHGCDVENCQHTGIQWIQCGGQSDWRPCDCEDDNGYDPDGYTIHTCGQAPHDCGSEVWDGVWPGYAECVEYGWYGHFELLDHPQFGLIESGSWSQCGPEHPLAHPDLNRLHAECDWDRESARWVKRARL
jgi:hypothetical protein